MIRPEYTAAPKEGFPSVTDLFLFFHEALPNDEQERMPKKNGLFTKTRSGKEIA
jgi:hypothetical protein